MKTLSELWKLLAVAALLATVAVTTQIGAGAQSSEAVRDPARFGMVGITRGQTARLNIVIPPSSIDAEQPAGPIQPPQPITLELKFVDGNGNLAFGNPDCHPTQDISCSQTSVTISPGQSAYFDLNGDNLVSGGMTRAQIRPVIIWQDAAIIWQKRTISTLEMIDNATSRTMWVYLPPSPCTATTIR